MPPASDDRAATAGRLAAMASMETGEDRHTERMLFLDADGRRYFAVLYLPGPEVRRRTTGIVQCHSFGFEQVTYRPLETRFARWAVARGYPVLYLHAQGYGDSDGDFEDVRIATHIRDAAVAMSRAPELLDVGSLIVQGIRLGALAGAAAASGRPEVEALALWHPLSDPRGYLRRMLKAWSASTLLARSGGPGSRPGGGARDTLQTRGMVDVLGFPLVRDLYEESERFDLLEALGSPPRRSFVCEVGRGSRVPDVVRMEEALRSAGSEVTTVRIPPLAHVEFAPAVPLTISPETQVPMFQAVIAATAAWMTQD